MRVKCGSPPGFPDSRTQGFPDSRRDGFNHEQIYHVGNPPRDKSVHDGAGEDKDLDEYELRSMKKNCDR